MSIAQLAVPNASPLYCAGLTNVGDAVTTGDSTVIGTMSAAVVNTPTLLFAHFTCPGAVSAGTLAITGQAIPDRPMMPAGFTPVFLNNVSMAVGANAPYTWATGMTLMYSGSMVTLTYEAMPDDNALAVTIPGTLIASAVIPPPPENPDVIVLGPVIPLAYRPTANVSFPTYVMDNTIELLGKVTVQSDGYIVWETAAGSGAPNFTTDEVNISATSITWSIVPLPPPLVGAKPVAKPRKVPAAQHATPQPAPQPVPQLAPEDLTRSKIMSAVESLMSRSAQKK